MKKKLDMTKPLQSEHILSVPWPFVISMSTLLPSYNVFTVSNLQMNSFLVKCKKKLLRFVSPLNHVKYNKDHVTYLFTI